MALLVSDPDVLEQIVHHVFLPPQLPQQRSDARIESKLFHVTADALRAFYKSLQTNDPARSTISRACATLQAAIDCHSPTDGALNESVLRQQMDSLAIGGTLTLQVGAQNAGLLLTRNQNSVRFEAFELSPQNQDVLAAQGRLIRQFPGFALDIPSTTYADAEFRAAVAQTVATMSGQAAPGVQPQIMKANKLVDEDRDTTHPAMVTEFLMGFLIAQGQRVDNIITVCKNTRDEVLFKDCEKPWRRSSAYLLIRVSLHLLFERHLQGSNTLYKAFMAFFMAKLLQNAQRLGVSTDLQYAMSAKIARRLQKQSNAGKGMPDHVRNILHDVQDDCSTAISRAWEYLQSQEHNPCKTLPSLAFQDFAKDSVVQLPLLDEWLAERSLRQTAISSALTKPVSRLHVYSQLQFPNLSGVPIDDYCVFNLHSFEDWCQRRLRDCATAHHVDTVCDQVYSLIKQYHKLASSQYEAVENLSATSNNPEGLSSMILTVLELWQAMDKRAVDNCPLLAEYDPQMPAALLQNLVLSSRDQLSRLERVELYLRWRRVPEKVSSDLFGDAKDSDCFAVRYYDQDDDMQELFEEITAKGEEERKAKVVELHRKYEEYEELDQAFAKMECTMYEISGTTTRYDPQAPHDRRRCKKCRTEDARNGMMIAVHERPLPARQEQAKAVIFELCIPPWYAKWRDCTAFVLQDVLKLKNRGTERPQNHYALCKDPHVGADYHPGDQRIVLWTKNKTHAKTHRKRRYVSSATEKDVCVDNATFYQYLDTASGHFVGAYESLQKVEVACTYYLPEHARELRPFLFRPANAPNGLSPNRVIASQSHCPTHTMTMDEYKEMCTVPGGNRIQWYNILLQLAAPTVDFKKEETALIFLQCIYQCGPNWEESSEGLRPSHAVLNDTNLARSLLENLNMALSQVKANWESTHALVIFTAIASRLLTMNKEVQLDCLRFLQKIRDIAFGWLQTVRERAEQAEDHVDRTHFLSKGIEIALVCGNTFDVDQPHLVAILDEDDNVAMLLHCAIAVAERAKSKKSLLGILAARFKRVLYRSYSIIRDAITHTGLDRAIKHMWAAFPSDGCVWHALGVDYWLETEVLAKCSTEPTTVRFNLLTGELLVDGLQHKTPPQSYQKHPTFKALFGNSSVEVMPSKVAATSFSTKGTYGGYNVHIGITEKDPRKPRDLLVIAMQENTSAAETRIWEIVPNRLLRQHFPDRFVDGHVHWYDVQSSSLQLRPIETPWDGASASNWTLVKSDNDSGWRLQRGQTCVLSSSCQTSVQITNVLSPLVRPSKVEIILQAGGDWLEIEVPTIQLGFTLRSRSSLLYSKEYRGMVVDESQTARTLIGLSNKLLLRPLKKANRLVLIPCGNVTYTRDADHVTVGIELQTSETVVEIHPFEIDERLGRLVDNGSLQSKLYIAYLHAVTAFALPDPLTQRTGTEQALSVLRSAAVHSFEQLSVPNIELLTRIAALSPARCYYPPDARVMQTVTWDPQLSFISQHGDFYNVVGAILAQAESLKIFYPGADVRIPSLGHVEEDLHTRDLIRTAVFRVAEYGAEHFTTEGDVEYQSRDRGQDSVWTTNACIMSRLIFSSCDQLYWQPPETTDFWKKVMDLENVYGAARPLPPGMMRYDALLMQRDSSSLAPYLLSLHRTLSKPQAGVNRSALMIWLSTMTLSPDADMALLQSVAMFLTAQALEAVQPPTAESFNPSAGQDVSYGRLLEILTAASVSYEDSPDSKSGFLKAPYGNRKENAREKRARCEPAYERQVRAISRDFAQEFRRQWLSDCTKSADLPKAAFKSPAKDYIDVDRMMEAVNRSFEVCRNNQALQLYLDQLQVAIGALPSRKFAVLNVAIAHGSSASSIAGHVTVDNAFSDVAPQALRDDKFPRIALRKHNLQTSAISVDACPSFRVVVDDLEDETADQDQYKKDYVESLRDSMNALQLRPRADDIVVPTQAELEQHLKHCEDFLKLVYSNLVKASERQLKNRSGGQEGLHWPRLSPSLFLAQLNRDRWRLLPVQWKTPIVQYGVAITAVQRAERLLNAAASGNKDDMMRELHENGHSNWDILKQPETLLLEVEGGIMVRAVQEDIAREMREPSSGGNQVIQLNMGEGKSSVIVPMVAAALGDGKQLVRVVVAKPQSKQMAQMLVSKLGGLMNRRIYYLPYSRALRLTRKSAIAIEVLCRECMENGGVLLLQPEHILSFKLTGPESMIAGNAEAGAIFLRIQEMFDQCSRDIVDESDENFDVKFELVYTLGLRRPVEFAPTRWGHVQQLLDLVKIHAQALFAEDPKTMEFNARSEGGFPRIRVLQNDIAQELIGRIAKDATAYGLRGLPTSQQSEEVRACLLKYVTIFDLTSDEVAAVEKSNFWTANTRQALLLIRGMLAGGILKFVFCQKRWRVTYGLTSRTPATRLAVPYRAKDSPAPRSEFSHPDVVILLTSLSYYYGGLLDEDLFTALGHLMTSDQADIEYQTWISDVEVPVEYRQLSGINIKDRTHCIAKVFPHLRFSKGAIDYWLNAIVFPRELKEYPHKLSASGCDLGRTKTLPTTCFSGTNDSRSLLCLDMRQIDLPEQSHTAALVLDYILRPENDVAIMPSTADAASTDAVVLLNMVMSLDPLPEVILDVGAFVLELDNQGVAEAWLAMHKENVKHAAVFCNEQDELCVVDRKSRVELLQTSSYKDRMDLCIVYLDEAHTRGIDLKLPVHWRAACTLGANLTKDRLVQACMRMRKLGKGQTIVFCVPDEIKESMLRDRTGQTSTEITLASVVKWVISQTLADIRHSMPLWVHQQDRFNRQQKRWSENTVDGHIQLTKEKAKKFREGEARSLEERYRPEPDKIPPLDALANKSDPRSRAIIARCKIYGLLDFGSRRLVAESERELSPEVDVDAERVVQKPPPAKARKHSLHEDILAFVLTGEPKRFSAAYCPAFHTLANTSAASQFDVKQFQSQRLLASSDFAHTIVDPGEGTLFDTYQRSVQWALTGLAKGTDVAEYIMVISPFEARRLIELGALLSPSRAALHMYRPRFNMRFRAMNKLDFHTIGRTKVDVRMELSVMLGVFAGSLYFSSYEEYQATCAFLGVISVPVEGGQKVEADGFIKGNRGGLRSSPVNMLKVLLSKIRRSSEDISKTHMGQLLEGKVFKPSDFEC